MANLDWYNQGQLGNYQGIGSVAYQNITSSVWPVQTQTYTIQCSHLWNDPEFYCPEPETKLLIQKCKLCNKSEILDL